MGNPAISFHYLKRDFSFRDRTGMKDRLSRLIKKEGKKLDFINYIFCDDAYLLQINQQHLNHDTYTDIITFHYHPKGAPIQSDIYISVDRVKENSKTFKTPFSTELSRVMIHGALHLCGFKDKSDRDVKLMRSKEDQYLDEFGVSRGT
jgi:probable rRNA maturation factor